ncbi:hypothetical protein L218DRAFT_684432 [Marasmius fiardii PR-910]|nr:hypothetical protein L218DRAFT_684432 [Marasmius fiardii PR-910]
MASNVLDGRVGERLHSPSNWNEYSQVQRNEERLKLITARAIPPTRSPPPTSFQDILPPSLIASPTSSNGSVSPKTPQDHQPSNTASRSRFAQFTRKAADSLRISRKREKLLKVDPVAVALMWAESASISKTSLSDTSSSNLSHEMTHDASHIAKSHYDSIHSNFNANNHHTYTPWSKTQMSSSARQASDSLGVIAERDLDRTKTDRRSKKLGAMRTVRFKEEREFIPTPVWTPSSSTWSLNSTDSIDRSNTNDHDHDSDDDSWEDLKDTPRNEGLALAAIERASVTHGHVLRGNTGVLIGPAHTNMISTAT